MLIEWVLYLKTISPISLVSDLGATADHAPLKHRYQIKISNRIRHMYLNSKKRMLSGHPRQTVLPRFQLMDEVC
jgi:hypothetical protein